VYKVPTVPYRKNDSGANDATIRIIVETYAYNRTSILFYYYYYLCVICTNSIIFILKAHHRVSSVLCRVARVCVGGDKQ